MTKKILLPLIILILNLNLTFGDVDTRLIYVSNDHNTPVPGTGTLIIDVEAQSSTLFAVDVSSFQDAFQLDAAIIPQVQEVVFSDQNFPASNYSNAEGFNSADGRINYEYTYLSGTRSSISGTLLAPWTLIVRVTVRYTMTDTTSTIAWYTGTPDYFVTDEDNNPITGNEIEIPPLLIDFPLPVELNTFAAKVNDSSVELKWQTKTEVNNHGFEIERASSLSAPFEDWEKIGFVPGNGNSNSIKNYSFIDKNPVGGKKFNYRLKQIDNDGSFSYSDIVEVELAPNKFELFQNYPNPFNPVTNIKFSIPNNSRVRLDVYNIIGEHLTTLIDEDMEAGFHSISFNANTLSTGAYIYKISAQNFSQTRKMVLVK